MGLVAMQTGAIADEAKPDTVQVHGKPLQLSCAEWKRNPDGSWTSIGALLVGTDTLTGVTLRGAKETGVLEVEVSKPVGSIRDPIPKRRSNATREDAGFTLRSLPREPRSGLFVAKASAVMEPYPP